MSAEDCQDEFYWNATLSKCIECLPGYYGHNCVSHCSPPFYGKGCQQRCEQCAYHYVMSLWMSSLHRCPHIYNKIAIEINNFRCGKQNIFHRRNCSSPWRKHTLIVLFTTQTEHLSRSIRKITTTLPIL
uniref:Uncharacterized protein LOC111127129 n=1 Tax=Crassostrea virginica TaxID=6565 RepID=A0A8B8DJI2_CRAVI|nr:uncharacterized protein LOC111127129 [Crassostrea virginica]